MSLKQKTISGLAWSFIDSMAYQGINFFIGIVLARLLSPKEFGLIGMTTIFTAVSQSFVNSGFKSALIRKANCGQKEYSTVFYFNLAVGVFCYGLLYFFAGPISLFFKEPQLVSLIRVLTVIIVINSIGLIQVAIRTKEVDFKRQAKISIAASLVSGAIGIGMAYTGWGVWSLVWRTISQSLMNVVLLWLTSKWRPVWLFDKKAFNEMFHFGSKLLVSGLIDTTYRNIYYLVIGKYFSATELGYYTRADGFNSIFSTNLSTIVGRVASPVLAMMNNDDDKLKAGYRRMIKSTMMISFVLMIGMAAVAKPMILTLIGRKWLTSVPYLQLLCLTGMFYPLQALNLDMLVVKGRSDLYLKMEVIKKILAVPNVIIGIFFGIKVMIVGMLVNTLIAYYLNSNWSGKMVNYPMREQIFDILPSFLLALSVGLTVFTFGHFIHLNHKIILVIQVLAGAGLTIGLARLFRVEAYLEMHKIIGEQWRRLRP